MACGGDEGDGGKGEEVKGLGLKEVCRVKGNGPMFSPVSGERIGLPAGAAAIHCCIPSLE